MRVKVILTLSVSLLILPLTAPITLPQGDSLLGISILIINEVSFGAFIGFASLLLFHGIQIAGEIIGFQMGFSIVNVIDPTTQAQISTIGELKYIIALLIYLAINGHHFLLQAIVWSFQVVPAGAGCINITVADNFIRMSVDVFVIALKIAGPAMVTLFLTSLALGIIARTVPQMNVFIVGFPLKIGVGLLILAAGMSYFGAIFTKMIIIAQQNIESLIIPGI